MLYIIIRLTMSKQIKLVKCPHCEYAWYSKSTHIYVSCPNCVGRVKIIDNILPLQEEYTDLKPSYPTPT